MSRTTEMECGAFIPASLGVAHIQTCEECAKIGAKRWDTISNVIEPERQDDDVRRDEIENRLDKLLNEVCEKYAKKRAKFVLEIEVDLDPVPGWGNKVEDFISHTKTAIQAGITHYNPTVTVQKPSLMCPNCGPDSSLTVSRLKDYPYVCTTCGAYYKSEEVEKANNAGGEDVKCLVVAQASKDDEEEPYCCQIGACRASGGSD